ncbi:uncharacterized protein LOC119741438 [Patiria miniata]|uniref:G-protein coupled receptors family 1 profile domain-containing protein n=1 Tax=Patiria miniata TaxID=46514 RepID=A0A914BAS1_PATMI|nr:uncharacterized protein LOC119741438 [Patiria miniata]
MADPTKETAVGHNYFTDDDKYLFLLMVNSLVFFLGVPGNCLILRVYWTKIRKTSTHVLIMALAWADLYVCLLRIPMIISLILYHSAADDRETFATVLNLTLCSECTGLITSLLITTIIAADRYDCICRPRRRFFTPRRAKVIVSATLLLSCAINIPLIVATITSYSLTLIILTVTFLAASYVIALVTMIVFYVRVYAKIRKHVKGAVPTPPVDHRDDVAHVPKRETNREIRPKVASVDMPVVNNAVSSSVDRPTSNTSRGNTVDNLQSKNQSKICAASAVHDVYDAMSNCPGTCSTKAFITNTTNSVALLPPVEMPMPDLLQKVAANGNKLPGPVGVGTGGEATQPVVSGDRRPHLQLMRHAPKKVGAAVLQRKTTRMLLVTSAVFLATWLPYLLRVTAQFAVMSGVEHINNLFLETTEYLVALLFVNNVANPLIYGVANRRFREDCRNVMSKMRARCS